MPTTTGKHDNRIFIDDRLAYIKLKNYLIEHVPTTQSIVVLCIGTDRSTGDSLGPLVGTNLQEKRMQHIKVLGTLERPVHAMNLHEAILSIEKMSPSPFIVAIDASLGSLKNVGSVECGLGGLLPGAALKKKISPVGDIYIKGYVNVGGFLEHSVLQSTKLYDVMQLAQVISRGVYLFELHLRKNISKT
ncbi:spore protease YyaC [Halalkalibacillus sediminis]|uniref:Spore protease YyaC n=1 Tax=Halalkalibacillus sediminis TaxID=2018042 RepID=A0A2I0QSW5_9BACI|nr:spore protease YyaC [Halalkalibacillus sediminis]PKR77427.1 spore protease YyaC [Halalkalibacillus sediminis]